jgi:hypothetical protein
MSPNAFTSAVRVTKSAAGGAPEEQQKKINARLTTCDNKRCQ